MNKKILNVITHMQTELESEREEREGGREDKREGEREGGREMMMGTDEIGNAEESEESRVLIGLRWLNNHNILDIISSSNRPVHINNLPVSTERQTSNNLHGGQGVDILFSHSSHTQSAQTRTRPASEGISGSHFRY